MSFTNVPNVRPNFWKIETTDTTRSYPPIPTPEAYAHLPHSTREQDMDAYAHLPRSSREQDMDAYAHLPRSSREQDMDAYAHLPRSSLEQESRSLGRRRTYQAPAEEMAHTELPAKRAKEDHPDQDQNQNQDDDMMDDNDYEMTNDFGVYDPGYEADCENDC